MAAGTELCPHCQRPFKRLRAHLPHCKAAPAAARAAAQPRSRSAAVRDVARSLDLHPEEVRGVPGQLRKGVQVVIEKHRARVLREKQPRSGGEGAGPGAAAPPQRRKSGPRSASEEPRGQGAAGSGAGGARGEKSRLKAAKALQESGNNRGEPAQQRGRDKFTAGEEEQMRVGFAAAHPEQLHPSLTEAFGGDGQGTSRNELRDSGEPGLEVGRAPGLRLPRAAGMQPARSARSAGAAARGLEWFPDLYPHYEGLRIFPGKHFHEDLWMAAETPKGGFTRGRQGPLSEKPLMEVRLGELHSWIRTCSFSPQRLLGAAQRAWSSYCAKYIHVKQGGPAGISMLLAGYCLFSYGWNYQHFKRHRWRKYH